MTLEIESYLSLYGNERAYVDRLLEDLRFFTDNEKYHYALNVYHLLFMLFVYQTLLKSRLWRPRKFRGSLIGFYHRDIKRNEILDTTSAFSFAKLPERSVMDYLEIFDANKDCIAGCKRLVDERNERSHANGYYEVEEELFSSRFDSYNETAAAIHKVTKRHLVKVFDSYTGKISRIETITGDDIEIDLIGPNYMSNADLLCLYDNITPSKRRIHKQVTTILKDSYGIDNSQSITEDLL